MHGNPEPEREPVPPAVPAPGPIRPHVVPSRFEYVDVDVEEEPVEVVTWSKRGVDKGHTWGPYSIGPKT